MMDNSEHHDHKVNWSGNIAIIAANRRLRNRLRVYWHEYNYDELNLSRGGLFDQCLYDCRKPVNSSNSNQTRIMLRVLKDDAEANAILNTDIDNLGRDKILSLYNLIEDSIETMGNVKEKNAASTQMRSMFSACSLPLKNGELIADINFTSRFISSHSRNFKYGKKTGIINQDKLIMAEHSNHDTLHKNILELMQDDIKKIEESCWESIELYKREKKRYQLLQKSPPAGNSNKLSDNDLLAAILCRIAANKLYVHENVKSYFGVAKIQMRDKYYHITSRIRELVNKPFKKFPNQATVQYLLLDYYLPKFVIEAAEVLFLIYNQQGWNTDVVISITKDNIKKVRGYYRIDSIKSKTDQIFACDVYKKAQPRFYELIELLLEHNENIDKYWKRENDSIFIVLNTSNGLFDVAVGKVKHYVCLPYSLPIFSKKQLRDQVANITYLETNDPFLVREMLGHTDIINTLSYLNQHAIRIINEANMRLFQDKLAASLAWSIKGHEGVKELGLKDEYIDSKLLFPIGSNESGATIISDEWIRSMGNSKFKIDNSMVEHLKWQSLYYQEYAPKLKQNNPKEYLLYHIPRMLFCAALIEIVRKSNYSYMLDN